MLRPALIAILLASPVFAQDDRVDVLGRFGTSDSGTDFRALLSTEGDFLRLRIFPVAPDGDEDRPLLDNAGITYSSTLPGARAWLEVSESGQLWVNTVTVNDTYTYSDRLALDIVENQITVIRWDHFNAYPVDGQPVAEPFQCGDACYSCEADLLAGTAVVGGETITVTPAPVTSLDAALWTPDSIHALGFCPAPD